MSILFSRIEVKHKAFFMTKFTRIYSNVSIFFFFFMLDLQKQFCINIVWCSSTAQLTPMEYNLLYFCFVAGCLMFGGVTSQTMMSSKQFLFYFIFLVSSSMYKLNIINYINFIHLQRCYDQYRFFLYSDFKKNS